MDTKNEGTTAVFGSFSHEWITAPNQTDAEQEWPSSAEMEEEGSSVVSEGVSHITYCESDLGAVREESKMASPMKEDDLLVPTSIHWSIDDVANWVEELGFPQYRECIMSNLIDGRKLVLLTASNLPRMGVTDFDHILFITAAVRDLLGAEPPKWNVCIADPQNTPMGEYLQKKSRTGPTVDKLLYSQFLRRGTVAQ